jgi:hypothetical protein
MKGELGTFSVAEILQLIGMQEKSGVLRVRSKGKSAVLFFDTGKVVSARDRRQGTRDPFLFYLQENGAIGLDQLNQVIEAKQNEGGDTIEILLALKIIDQSDLASHLADYSRQTLENMVKWETGTYEFAASTDGMPEKSIARPLRLEPILMEALRRKDEVEEIRRFLPSFDTAIQVAEVNLDDLHLETQDADILGLVDGRRTIEEIIEESSTEEVETLDILERLFALGVVSIAEVPDHETTTRILSPLRSVAVTAAILILGAALRFTILAPETPGAFPVNKIRGGIQDFVDSRELENLEVALNVYRSINGAYPENIDKLVTAGLVGPSQIRSGPGKKYSYMYLPSQDGYSLTR